VMTIGQFILFLMKHSNLAEQIELLGVKQELQDLVLKLRGLPAMEIISENDRLFLEHIGIAV
jgi:hypothetical protein